MKNRIIMLGITLLLIQSLAFCRPYQSEKATPVNDSLVLESLKEKYGFQGSLSIRKYSGLVTKRFGAVFTGRFPLPVPTDTINVSENSRKIAGYFEDLYDFKSSNYTLEELHKNDSPSLSYSSAWLIKYDKGSVKSYTKIYYQYYNNLIVSDLSWLEPMISSLSSDTDKKLLIGYDFGDSTYTIASQLYTESIDSKKISISTQEAFNIASDFSTNPDSTNSHVDYSPIPGNRFLINPVTEETEYKYIYLIELYRNTYIHVDAASGDILKREIFFEGLKMGKPDFKFIKVKKGDK